MGKLKLSNELIKSIINQKNSEEKEKKAVGEKLFKRLVNDYNRDRVELHHSSLELILKEF